MPIIHNELFRGAKNVDFIGTTMIKGREEVLLELTLKEPSAEEWNSRAAINNTKAFIKAFNRQPKDNDELMIWIYSTGPIEYVPDKYKSHLAVTR